MEAWLKLADDWLVRASLESHREMLLKMAATWDGLAEDRERTIARQERIAKLEKDARAEPDQPGKAGSCERKAAQVAALVTDGWPLS